MAAIICVRFAWYLLHAVASAEQFIAVSIAAANSGIYSDKGLDAVKEFGLRIREQTKATGDALRKALGSEFTDKLFSDLNRGAISTVDALGQFGHSAHGGRR